jgi:4-hydroxybenzoyl-CoA thioesterase
MKQPFIKQEKIRFQHVDYAGIVFYPRFLEMLNYIDENGLNNHLLSRFLKCMKPINFSS